MMQNQQIIALSEASEPQVIQPDQPAQQSQQQPSDDQHLFQAIEKYLQEHCCIKFILFLVIILLVVAVYQEKGYLIKKQRTFNFFIDKIQKEKIKKEIISETQEGAPRMETGNLKVEIPQGATMDKSSTEVGIVQESKESIEKGEIKQQKSTQKADPDPQQQKYASIQGISMPKIVQSSRWRNLKNEDIMIHSELAKEQQAYYQSKYGISKYKELPFCVVVPTFNNTDAHRHFSNIQSIIMQNYENFHIVVIDDASTDGTGAEIKTYLEKQTKIKPERYKVIQNEKNVGNSMIIRKAALAECVPQQIFVIVDGDDELVGRQILKLYNAVYQQTGAWIVYSNFFTEQGKLGYSKPFPSRVMKENAYRKYPFVTSHLRSMYTGLLRQIKQQDLKDKDGKYFTVANDVAMMMPCLEMAQERVIYIPELTYMYSQRTGLNNHQMKLIEQKRNQRYIRKKQPYNRLETIHDVNFTAYNQDSLKSKSSKMKWLKQAMQVQEKTEDLGTVTDRFTPASTPSK